jgi:hypothetical protein
LVFGPGPAVGGRGIGIGSGLPPPLPPPALRTGELEPEFDPIEAVDEPKFNTDARVGEDGAGALTGIVRPFPLVPLIGTIGWLGIFKGNDEVGITLVPFPAPLETGMGGIDSGRALALPLGMGSGRRVGDSELGLLGDGARDIGAGECVKACEYGLGGEYELPPAGVGGV